MCFLRDAHFHTIFIGENSGMKLTSPAFINNAKIPVKYTCKGENVSPPLIIKDVPPNAKSLVLTVEDADSGSPAWVHWFVFNIPPRINTVPEGKIPENGLEGRANGGTRGYEGPCPVYFRGTHHYRFNLYALDMKLEAPPTTAKSDIAQVISDNTIAIARLTGLAEGTGERL